VDCEKCSEVLGGCLSDCLIHSLSVDLIRPSQDVYDNLMVSNLIDKVSGA